MMYKVEFWRDGRWQETWAPVMPTKTRTEAERLAARRSENTDRIYRVRSHNRTVSEWRNGNQVAKEA